MKQFKQLDCPDMRDVLKLRVQLQNHPHLWNERRERLNAPPFVETDDIWIRANDDTDFREGHRPWHEFTEEHWPIWYPAIEQLSAVKPIVYNLMAQVRAEHLGGVLITRIPPGAEVKPHADTGWHATFHNCKVYVPIESNGQVWNGCGGERVVMNAGEAWTFNNLISHYVVNKGRTPRVTLIVSMRVDE